MVCANSPVAVARSERFGQTLEMGNEGPGRLARALFGDKIDGFHEPTELCFQAVQVCFLPVEPLQVVKTHQESLLCAGIPRTSTSSFSWKRGPAIVCPMDAIKPPRSCAISAFLCLI